MGPKSDLLDFKKMLISFPWRPIVADCNVYSKVAVVSEPHTQTVCQIEKPDLMEKLQACCGFEIDKVFKNQDININHAGMAYFDASSTSMRRESCLRWRLSLFINSVTSTSF